MTLLYTVLLVAACAGAGYCLSGSTIAAKADSHINSTKWSYASAHGTGSGTNKCNQFVADVVIEAGGSVPQLYSSEYSPIGANEWAKSNSNYLTGHGHDGCSWTHVTSANLGDVAAIGGHVGIVTGTSPWKTTSASSRTQKVEKNNWGKGLNPTLWRYVC